MGAAGMAEHGQVPPPISRKTEVVESG